MSPHTAAALAIAVLAVREGIEAWGGERRAPAALNLGDCFSHALARVMGRPLRLKGADFGQTDITPAYAS